MSIIAISRGTSSGGRGLARALAERLGYQCLSREEIQAAAASYGVPMEKLVAELEKSPSFWERLTGYHLHYLNYVRAALCEHARDGNLIYYGHAAHLLVPNVPHVICVRVIADTEDRIRLAVANHHVSRKEAIAYIEKTDREQTLWARFDYGVNWDDSSLYDVVLNLSHMSIASACEILARMAELEEYRPTPESLKAIRDLALGSRVWAALAGDPQTTASDLQVVADEGAIIVSGTTHSREVFDAIPMVAAQVEGVSGVTNRVIETSHSYP